jgi:hypothetical protein
MDSTAHVTTIDTAKSSVSRPMDQVRRLMKEQPQRRPVVEKSPGGFAEFGLPVIFILGIAVLIIMYFRSRRGVKVDRSPRSDRLKAVRDREGGQTFLNSTWTVKDLGEGGRFHLSLSNGLEEDFEVERRDRIDRPDGRVEYDLVVLGPDPDYPYRVHWWVIGSAMNCWLFETGGEGLAGINTDADSLQAMLTSKSGRIVSGDDEYELSLSGVFQRLEGGRRPVREFTRWVFRHEDGRMIVVQVTDGDYEVLIGEELWLRDMGIIRPKTPGIGADDTLEDEDAGPAG